MHSADAVVYPVVRSRRAVGLLAAIWVTGVLCVCVWCANVPARDWLRITMLMWTFAAGLAAGHWWMRSGAGQLHWDGQHWSVESTNGASQRSCIFEAEAVVALDLQGLLLLRLQAPRRVRWVLVDRAAAPERWHALRCAVMATAVPPLPAAGMEASVR